MWRVPPSVLWEALAESLLLDKACTVNCLTTLGPTVAPTVLVLLLKGEPGTPAYIIQQSGGYFDTLPFRFGFKKIL